MGINVYTRRINSLFYLYGVTMFLNEVHEQLAAAELSKLAMGGDGSGELREDDIPKINRIIQAGISDLYTKFSIKEGELLLRTKIGKNKYELKPANSVSSGDPFAFIIDSPDDPFLGDILQLISITAEDGYSVRLHEDVGISHTYLRNPELVGLASLTHGHISVTTPTYNTLLFKEGHNGGDVLVRYKAKPKSLDFSLAPENVFIELPDHFLQALVYYVAHRLFNPMGSETIGRGMFHEGNNYAAKYKDACDSLKADLPGNMTAVENTNFVKGGWV